ncbi:MAG: DUF2934 domain-containing protein [Vicinamibacterales bacterium]
MTVKKTTPTRTRKTAAAAKTPTSRPAAPRSRTRKAARPPAPADTSAADRPLAVSDEDIRVRAYFLALEHQGRGDSRDFWLQAERELRAAAQSGR